MANLNQVTLIGRLGRDAEVKDGSNGQFVVFSVAAESRKDKTVWYDVSYFGGYALDLADSLVKGTLVYLQGDFTQEKWEKNGRNGISNRLTVNKLQILTPRNNGRVADDDEEDGDSLPF